MPIEDKLLSHENENLGATGAIRGVGAEAFCHVKINWSNFDVVCRLLRPLLLQLVQIRQQRRWLGSDGIVEFAKTKTLAMLTPESNTSMQMLANMTTIESPNWLKRITLNNNKYYQNETLGNRPWVSPSPAQEITTLSEAAQYTCPTMSQPYFENVSQKYPT